ncbi:hypothetical protein NGB36_30240 [Streptomyces sp. RB6PN25]|uniref:Methyltransferase type 12 n=1 Tax=Streptomyces humicola TaxID=2953240 RepID=A0ABT1Q486_9ACTN|nr:hypothetical protein [Streptomyces humicola]MCQ4084738.1 hypothetical protein [Streptomyces humicola]
MTDSRRDTRKISGVDAMTRFDDIYDQPDPRDYFRRLGPLEYQIPHHGQDVFRRTVAARAAVSPGPPITVLDLCCGYGINAALLNHDVSLAELYEHYVSRKTASRTTAKLIEWDKAYFAARRRPHAARVDGLDPAGNAVGYARAVGLLDEGFAENLEEAPPSSRLRRAMERTELITVTGGIGFISSRTFGSLLDCAREPVWVASFAVRTVSYQPIADCLAEHGLVTEKATARTFPQRRFTSTREQQYAIDAVAATGEDPDGKETDGYVHATLYLSRPQQDAAAMPVDMILARAGLGRVRR